MGSFILVFLAVFGALGLIAGIPAITGVAVVLAIVTAVDMALAVRRQRRGKSEEAG
ncbi:hypothetical protein ACIBHY_39400 [Nonomuraea sp. NPDC050547]|uniref:hypothetical protein n=1 Tax=Nonomuraea sp. NPDC050547 TaxID=3364368 RepID=UPI00378C3919